MDEWLVINRAWNRLRRHYNGLLEIREFPDEESMQGLIDKASMHYLMIQEMMDYFGETFGLTPSECKQSLTIVGRIVLELMCFATFPSVDEQMDTYNRGCVRYLYEHLLDVTFSIANRFMDVADDYRLTTAIVSTNRP